MRLFGFLAASALLLTACGGAVDEPGEDVDLGSEASDAPVTVELTDTGFGQRDEYVQGIAVVTTDDDRAVGEFVTVSMNFLDDSGDIVGTSDQVESFTWVGQELVLPIWFSLSETPGVEVAEVDASVSISDYGRSREEVDPLETVESREIRANQFGGTTAVFELTNPLESNLENARIGVVCYGVDGSIIGGTSEYPNLIAAGQSVLLESDVLTSGEPENCVAYPNYGM